MEEATDKQTELMKKLEIQIPAGCSKQHAAELISQKLGKPLPQNLPSKPTYKPKSQDNSSYYVAYAKDLCIALVEAGQLDPEAGRNLKDIAVSCIDIVKEMKKAFEDG